MRKFLVIMDSSTECLSAIRYAGARAARVEGGVTMLAVIPPEEFNHWIGVADIMRQEARERIEAHFEIFSNIMRDKQNITPNLVIREGEPVKEILQYIGEDPEIGVLVLGAATTGEGPGPLVKYMTKSSGNLPVPVTIVPGSLSKEKIEAVS